MKFSYMYIMYWIIFTPIILLYPPLTLADFLLLN